MPASPLTYTFLGPEGTFTEAALLQVRAARDGERLAYPSVDAALAAVREGEVAAAMVQTPAARPSTPSVKFTTFITATIPMSVSG